MARGRLEALKKGAVKGIEPSLSAWEVDNGYFGVKDGAVDEEGKFA